MAVPERWDMEHFGVLSEDTIRARLEHPERYRINTHRFPSGTTFNGQTRDGLVYVLKGCCKYTHEGGETVLRAMEYSEIPQGGFNLEVQGHEDYEEVRVWPLPEAFWPVVRQSADAMAPGTDWQPVERRLDALSSRHGGLKPTIDAMKRLIDLLKTHPLPTEVMLGVSHVSLRLGYPDVPAFVLVGWTEEAGYSVSTWSSTDLTRDEAVEDVHSVPPMIDTSLAHLRSPQR